ncbi:MAG: hypothetical protein ABSA66_15860 [Roseiarcus sp.]|jgi:hypothetical protein
MANVSLDETGALTGIYAMPQTFSTVIADDDPRIAAFLAAQTPAPSLTFLQFMALFAPAEQAAIVASADPQIKLFTLMAAGAGALQLSNPEVVAGVNYLATSGAITAARATAILAGQAPS